MKESKFFQFYRPFWEIFYRINSNTTYKRVAAKAFLHHTVCNKAGVTCMRKKKKHKKKSKAEILYVNCKICTTLLELLFINYKRETVFLYYFVFFEFKATV